VVDLTETEPVRPGRRWLVTLARVVFNLSFAGFLFWVGVMQLTVRRPNVWIAGGLAIFLWTLALVFADRLRDLRPGSNVQTTLLRRWRIQFAGYLIAACLWSIGCAIHGGAIGIFGAIVGLVLGSWFLWGLQQLAKAR
jgi:hypothetical protein